jgi:hypothetical protein
VTSEREGAAAGRAGDLVPGFRPETELEETLARQPELLAGLAWGKPRKAHPEGAVGVHVADLLREIDARGEDGERRALLRAVALVHDSFKYKVREWLPRSGANHHAMRARRFAERFTGDERVLATIELHDRPYALWRRMRRKGRLDEVAFAEMMRQVPDADLFLAFVELDGSTDGKSGAPVAWFSDELRRRGIVR